MAWERTAVDGVPAYWVDAGDDLKAFLVFRVGAADEQLATRGITHLVEHLAMHSVNRPVHTANGRVDETTTVFATTGSAQEVTEFLTGVCRSLRALPFDRLDVENQILRTEANGQSPAVAEPLMLWRYGAATYGLSAYPEFGVGRHSPDQITAWVERWFTRDNAVLAFAGGPPPSGLTLDLPAGERVPPPAPSSALRGTPAYFYERSNAAAMSALVSRSTAAHAYAMLLGRRLQQSLRQESGLSYSPSTSYDPRDGQTAHVIAFADGLPENHAQLVPAFVHELELIADQPASAEEIRQVVTRLHMIQRESVAGRAFGNAMRELFGKEPISDADLEARLDAVNPDNIRQTATEALESALLMLPGYEPPGRRFRQAPGSSLGTVDGQTLRSADAPIDPGRLIIGTEGVSRIEGPRYVTVKFNDCEAMLAWPDGARRLIGRDGFTLTVEPTLWAGGSFLPAHLDSAVPTERILKMPQRSTEDIPAPKTSRYDRARARFKRR